MMAEYTLNYDDVADRKGRREYQIMRTDQGRDTDCGSILCLPSVAHWLDERLNAPAVRARLAGAVISAKKIRASRRNGKLGGRPKKVAE